VLYVILYHTTEAGFKTSSSTGVRVGRDVDCPGASPRGSLRSSAAPCAVFPRYTRLVTADRRPDRGGSVGRYGYPVADSHP